MSCDCRCMLRRENPPNEMLEHMLEQIRIYLIVLATELGYRD